MSFRNSTLLASSLAVLLLSGCTVGPKYQRPQVPVPPSYRGGAGVNSTPANASATAASLGAEKWSTVFQDPILQKLISEAITNNYDIRIAAQRILEEQDQLGVTRAQEYPTLSGGASYDAVGLPASISKALSGNNNNSNNSNSGRRNIYAGGLSLSAAWNLDFWGYYRSQTAAARDQLLASTWARRMTIDTVVENVATAYFQLRTLDAELAITRQTVAARKNSLQLTQTLERGGSGTLEDVRQAQESLYQATAEIPDLERQIAQQEDALSILLGRNPGPILRGHLSSVDWPDPVQVPAGLPLQLLERRPDIEEAEAQLRADNANVRVARARFFPQLSITGNGGTDSSQFKQLFDSGNILWYVTGSLTQNIFDAGSLRNNLHLTQAEKQQQVLTYAQTIQKAFQNVSDSLIALRRYREYRAQEEKYVAAAKDATRLARMRYKGGATSYLEVLTNDTTYYQAQISLLTAREQEALSFVQLYSALGGGWQ
jgi:multidrug efflux system outer membrane protein